MSFEFLYPGYKQEPPKLQAETVFKPSQEYKETKKTIKLLKKQNLKLSRFYKTIVLRIDKLSSADIEDGQRFINFYKREEKRIYKLIEKTNEKINKLQHKLDYELTESQ